MNTRIQIFNDKDDPVSVQRFNEGAQRKLNELPAVWVEGEITSYKEQGYNGYGKLKDLNNPKFTCDFILPIAIRKQSAPFEIGTKVVVLASTDLYAMWGRFQAKIQRLHVLGEGEHAARLAALEKKLEKEGLFEDHHKKPLPFIPTGIGMITGKTGAAQHDVIQNVKKRWADAHFIVEHTLVQGAQSPAQIIAALQKLDADPDVDVIVVTRGGGSTEDLLGFSDEALLRQVFATVTPVICAIGHKEDHPLIERVADVCASTPTDVATFIPRYHPQESLEMLQAAREHLTFLVNTKLDGFKQTLDLLAQSLGQPTRHYHDWLQQLQAKREHMNNQIAGIIRQHQSRLQELTPQVQQGIERTLSQKQQMLQGLEDAGLARSPKEVLQRGYSLTTITTTDKTNKQTTEVVTSMHQAPKGALVHVQLAEGSLEAQVERQNK